MFIHVPFILFFPETEFSGSDRWGILQFQFTARCSADAVHVPEAERRPQGRKILPEPPGPSRRRCESLALPMALGVRLPEEWIHMMVWSKNNRARYGAPVFFGVVWGKNHENQESNIITYLFGRSDLEHSKVVTSLWYIPGTFRKGDRGERVDHPCRQCLVARKVDDRKAQRDQGARSQLAGDVLSASNTCGGVAGSMYTYNVRPPSYKLVYKHQ